jgi:hypothetical protein
VSKVLGKYCKWFLDAGSSNLLSTPPLPKQQQQQQQIDIQTHLEKEDMFFTHALPVFLLFTNKLQGLADTDEMLFNEGNENRSV